MADENLNENVEEEKKENIEATQKQSGELNPTDNILKQIPIFSSLKHEDIIKIRELREEATVYKNSVIFNQGDIGDAFYILADGKVKITKTLEEGGETTLAVFRDGDFFGEMALIEDQPRTATATALEDCKLFKITKQNFEFLMRLNPTISLKIMRFMSERVRTSSQAGKIAEKEAKVITLFSPKGGIGKTMLGVNMAYALSKNPENRILLLDFDLEFGDFAKMIKEAKSCKTVIDLLKEIQVLSIENINPFLFKVSKNITLLAAPDKPEDAELVTAQSIKELIEVFSGYYDYIIIDSATSFRESTLVSMDMAWRLCFILGPDFISVQNTQRSLNVLKSLDYDENIIYPIVNMNGGSKFDLGLDDVEKYTKVKVSHVLPYDYETAYGSIGNGSPYIDSYPNSKLAASTVELVNKLCGERIEVPKVQDSQGFLAKLFG